MPFGIRCVTSVGVGTKGVRSRVLAGLADSSGNIGKRQIVSPRKSGTIYLLTSPVSGEREATRLMGDTSNQRPPREEFRSRDHPDNDEVPQRLLEFRKYRRCALRNVQFYGLCPLDLSRFP